MNHKIVRIVDQSCGAVATARVLETDGGFAGSIDLRSMPEGLLGLLEAYEEVVNGQTFSLLDEVEEQLGEIPLVAIFEDGEAFPVEDLQIYPSDGRVSFKLAERKTRHNGQRTYSDLIDGTPRTQAESRNQA